MLHTKLTSAALVAALALVPATRVAADSKDFIAGALLGGVTGAIIQKEVRKNREQQRARTRTVAPQTYAAQPRRYTAKKTYRPSIPATQEGRQIQSSLNYFGFNAGTVDGQVGQATRAAISSYQSYLGYPATGSLNAFEQELLVSSYNRALAGGDQTFRQIAAQPDGTRGLLKLYRSEIASGERQTGQTPAPIYGTTNDI